MAEPDIHIKGTKGLAQCNIRRLTLARLRFLKPHTGTSIVDFASDVLDKRMRELCRRRGIKLPPECDFSVTE